jgi:hypothetical protein
MCMFAEDVSCTHTRLSYMSLDPCLLMPYESPDCYTLQAGYTVSWLCITIYGTVFFYDGFVQQLLVRVRAGTNNECEVLTCVACG